VLISSSQKAMRVPRKRIAELVAFTAAAEGAPLAEADVAVVTSRRIARLNRLYLNRPGATDVLSFDLSGPAERAIRAQIVVCGDVAAAQARRRKCSAARELMLYVVHGLLHVMGYDDSTPAAAKMHARQEQLLDAFLHRR
jgi:probable rRNA maturation factor